MSVIPLCPVCLAEHGSDITDWASGRTILSPPRVQCTTAKKLGAKTIEMSKIK